MTYTKISKLKTLKRLFWGIFSRYVMVLVVLYFHCWSDSWWGRRLWFRWFLTFISFNLGLEEIKICRLTCFIISKYNKSNFSFIAKTLQKAFILKKHHHQSNKLKGSVEDVWSNIYCTCSCASLIPLNYLTVHVFHTSQIVCVIKNVKRILIEPSSSKSTRCSL